MISLKNITKTYTARQSSRQSGRQFSNGKTLSGKNSDTVYRHEVHALNGVSLDFAEKGLVFIVGKSGSGKTTLLNILGGVDTPTGGEMTVNGVSFSKFKGKDLDNYRNHHVGFIFQEYHLLRNYRAGKNISLAIELQGEHPSRERVDEIMRQVELTDLEGQTFYDRKVTEMSGGQKQRVAIARALIKNPDIILADEPTGALDYTTGEQLYELLKKLSEDKLIVVVTHDDEAAEKYGDRIIRLEDGRVVQDTNPYHAETEGAAQNASLNMKSRRTAGTGTSGKGTACIGTAGTCTGTAGAGMAGAGIYGAGIAGTGAAGTGKTGAGTAGAAADAAVPQKTHYKGLVWSRCFAMGAAGLKHKVVRLVISIILAVAFLGVVGFAITAATADDVSAELKDMYARGYQTVIIESDSYREAYYIGTQNTTSRTTLSGLWDEQIELMSEYVTPNLAIGSVDMGSLYGDYTEYSSIPYGVAANPYNYIGLRTISHIIELDPETGEEDANLTPVTADSRLPQSYDEIAITDYRADLLLRYGFRTTNSSGTKYWDTNTGTDTDNNTDTAGNSASGSAPESEHVTSDMLSGPEDLIGKRFSGLTIVGIFSTDENLDAIKAKYDTGDVYTSDIDNYVEVYDDQQPYFGSASYIKNTYGLSFFYWTQSEHIMNDAFVLTGYSSSAPSYGPVIQSGNTCSLYKLQGSISKDRKVVKAMTMQIDDYVTYINRETGEETNYLSSTYYLSAKFAGIHSYNVEEAKDYLPWEVIAVAEGAAVIFAVISLLLAINFIINSVSARRKELGILRALGAKQSDVTRICLCEGGYIALIEFVLSLIVVGIMAVWFNSQYFISYFFMGILPILALFGLSFCIIAIAVVVSVLWIMKKRPIEIINSASAQ